MAEARIALTKEEADKLLDQDALARDAVSNAENNGIVFLDEIDKVCARTGEGGFRGGDVSREGVQRDLLPLIEGTTVTTKHGPVKTDHILFIASGAFHLAKPSDLLPELQGRLPIRVELAALTRDDFRRILTEPEHSLLKQYTALLGTEGVTLDFADDAVEALADLAAEINASVENIGARRLATVLERLLEEVSFTASDRGGEMVRVDAAHGDGPRRAAGRQRGSVALHPVAERPRRKGMPSAPSSRISCTSRDPPPCIATRSPPDACPAARCWRRFRPVSCTPPAHRPGPGRGLASGARSPIASSRLTGGSSIPATRASPTARARAGA